jgi:hypothetical protein
VPERRLDLVNDVAVAAGRPGLGDLVPDGGDPAARAIEEILA